MQACLIKAQTRGDGEGKMTLSYDGKETQITSDSPSSLCIDGPKCSWNLYQAPFQFDFDSSYALLWQTLSNIEQGKNIKY